MYIAHERRRIGETFRSNTQLEQLIRLDVLAADREDIALRVILKWPIRRVVAVVLVQNFEWFECHLSQSIANSYACS